MQSSILGSFLKRLNFILSLLILVALAFTNVNAQPQYGCHLIKYEQSQNILSPEERTQVQSTIERSDSFDILDYEISIDMTNFSSNELNANTIVTFSPSMEDLMDLRLDLEGLNVDSVLFKNTHIPYYYDGRFLDIEFAEALESDSAYQVQVFYHGEPIICNEDGFGGFYFENNVAYNLGIGIDCIPHNYGRVWFPCFDNFVERSTYTYNILTDDGDKGYAVGNLIDTDTISGDTILRTFRMEQPIPTYLSHVAIGPLGEINKIAESEYDDIPVQLVVQNDDRSQANNHFKNIQRVLQNLEYWYGPYMWDRIGFHMTSRGAMEHPTGVAYPSAVLSGTDLGLQTHELAHHWWGNIVTLRTDADMWIKEGPSSYAEQQIVEEIRGEEAFKNAVRLNNLNMVRTAHIADDGFLPLSPMPQRITYGVHTYDKGAAMIHNLRGYLGDSLFRQGMQYVLEERTYGNLNAMSFRDLLMEGTSVELVDFFNDWILSPGWSDFAVNSFDAEEENGRYLITGVIEQSQYHSGHFHQNVPIQLTSYFSDLSSSDTTITASGETTSFSFYTDEMPSSIIVNDDYNLCLASFTKSNRVESEGNINFPGIQMNTYCDVYNEDDILSIEHHYSAPPELIDQDKNLELSQTHYWKVGMAKPEVNSYGFSFNFSGSDTSDLDYHILRDGIDSLLLLYKANDDTDWVEVSDYNIIKTGSSSGIVASMQFKDGLYALGHGQSGVYTSVKKSIQSDISIYPTVVNESFTIENNPRGKAVIHSIAGNQIGEYELNTNSNLIELPVILPGMYVVSVYNERNDLIHQKKLIKK